MTSKFFKPALEWLGACALAVLAIWLAAILTIFLILPALTPTAHATEAAVSAANSGGTVVSAAGPAQDYTCTPHRVLWFTWGWDCRVPPYTNTLTLTTDAANIWCDGQGAQTRCKATAGGTLQINGNGFASLLNARAVDIALHCITTPGNPVAQCQVAIEGGEK